MKNSFVRRGFTLIELLVVMTIIGILIGLTLPAINTARESARRMVCVNNLTQISRAFTAHVTAQGFFPSGGWGYFWIGEPDCGYGSQQPGGWLFSILDYMEQGNVRNQGLGLDGSDRVAALRDRLKTPIPIINCPTRRTRNIYPTSGNTKYQTQQIDHSFVNLKGGDKRSIQTIDGVDQCIKGDYATNAGTFGHDLNANFIDAMINAHSGVYFNIEFSEKDDNGNPKTDKYTPRRYTMEFVFLNNGNYSDFYKKKRNLTLNKMSFPYSTVGGDKPNVTSDENKKEPYQKGLNGISFLFSEVTPDEVEDGLANTYMVGEKYLNTAKYIVDNNDSYGDNESAYDGADNDNQRICSQGPGRDRKTDWTEPFGSAHAISFNMAFCDGSVRRVNYNINTEIHWKLCNRRSGNFPDSYYVNGTDSRFSSGKNKITDWSAISD